MGYTQLPDSIINQNKIIVNNFREHKQTVILEGTQVRVRKRESFELLSGGLFILNDSTIMIDSNEVLISHVDFIRLNTTKRRSKRDAFLIAGSFVTVTGGLLLTRALTMDTSGNFAESLTKEIRRLFVGLVGVVVTGAGMVLVSIGIYQGSKQSRASNSIYEIQIPSNNLIP